MSNFQQYTGDARTYSAYPMQDVSTGVTRAVVSGDICDFGTNAVPTDSRWASHAGPATVTLDPSVNVPLVNQLPVTAAVYNPGTGAPTSGSYVAGQECRDSAGAEFVCTVSGTPGTWVSAQNATYAPLPTAVRNPLTGWFHADGAGVKCDGTTGDTAALNAAITACNAAGGGTVYVPRIGNGNLLLDAKVVHKSRVRVVLAGGLTVTRKAAVTGNIWSNAAATAVATAADGAITSGAAVLTTSLASQAAVGQTVIVGTQLNASPAGAGTGGGLLVANITAVTSTTVTLSVVAGTTTTTAAVALYNRDVSIGLECEPGVTWNLGDNSGASGIGLHHMLFRRVDGLRLAGGLKVNTTGGKYGVSLGNCTAVHADAPAEGTTSSDGFHVAGPAVSIRVDKIGGIHADDACAFTATDYPTYSDTEGPITDVEVGDIFTDVSGTASALKLTANSAHGTYVDRLHARNVHNLDVTNGGTNDTAFNMASDTGNLDIRNVTIDYLAGKVLVGSGTIGSVTVGTFDYSYTGAATAPSPAGCWSFTGSGTANSITVRKWYTKHTSATAVHGIYCHSTMQIANFDVQGGYYSSASANCYFAFFDNTGGITNLRISNFHRIGNGSGGMCSTQNSSGTTALANVWLSNTEIDSAAWIGDINTTSKFFLTGVNESSANAFNIRAAGAVTVRGAAMSNGTSSVTAGGTIASKALDFQIDIAKLTPAAGDMATNTNAGSGTVGPNIYSGSAWAILT